VGSVMVSGFIGGATKSGERSGILGALIFIVDIVAIDNSLRLGKNFRMINSRECEAGKDWMVSSCKKDDEWNECQLNLGRITGLL
jgi:hypothetical protein